MSVTGYLQQLISLVLSLAIGLTAWIDPSSNEPTSPNRQPSRPVNTNTQAVTAAGATAKPIEELPVKGIQHIVVVVEENHAYDQIVGSMHAPFMNELIKEGALFTDAHGVTHPSQPNYLALFSGSTQGMTGDQCSKTPYSGANLASALIAKQRTFTGYSEGLPHAGFTGCWAGQYGRKHNPWAQFKNVPAASNQSMTAFPSDYNKLPTVSFVIPDLDEDMHDGTVAEADHWLSKHLGGYASWAKTHHSLLIVTWDEDNNTKPNHIPTFITGSNIRPGSYSETINHYSILRLIESIYQLPALGHTKDVKVIKDIWAS